MSKPHVPKEIKHQNQRHHPPADHPFRSAFSARRMQAPDCNVRRAPYGPQADRSTSKPQANEKTPWHQRKLPDDWSPEEKQFFANWRSELAALHDALRSTAADRIKLLKRARAIYFKLAWKLNAQVGGGGIRSSSKNSIESVRR